ncbi:MAG: hypothetical protein K6B52_04235, partial [Clostridiales bacterium]|nr:hypothetical protein [Clostridiales bacterium]
GDESDLPVGCGRYKFVKSGEEIGLEVNSLYKNYSPNIGNVTLVPIKDVDSMQSSLSIGNTVFSFDDLSKGEYLRLSAKNVNVTLNHLIFIGINGANSYFSSSFLRRAVNAAVDRENIALSAFRGYAKTAYSPFNPDWYQLLSRDLVFQPDVETAEDFVISSGVDVKNRYINLIVFEDNAFKCEAAGLIEESLEKIGFAVNVKECSEEEYRNLIEIGGYDLYIGEVALTENMDLNCFFAPENTFGVDGEGQSALRYFELMSGNCEIMDFINTFNEDIPFVPLCYRCAVASYTNSLKADFTPNSFDVFSDFESWKLN